MRIRVELYENVFLSVAGAMLVVMLAAIFASLPGHGAHVPEPAGRIPPDAVARTPPFDRPGVVEEGPRRYRATIVARMWSFTPREVRVPAGSTVTFQVASADVLHGFRIDRTNVNAMVVPGEVTRVTHTFERPGEYLMICHEYCGIAHQAMAGRVVVDPRPADRGRAPHARGVS